VLTEETVFSQLSWVLQNKTTKMAVTHVGAHLAPVYFNLSDTSVVQPYYVSPWQSEDHAYLDGKSEGPLRGDFFCLPFGRADPDDGTPAHGRTASALWTFSGFRILGRLQELSIQMNNALHAACVDRKFFLRDGEDVIYDKTIITGLTGSYTFGHHAVLRVPAEDSALFVSTSKQKFSSTYPGNFCNPANAEYQSLAIGSEFSDLSSVPSIFKEYPNADCSRYPARRGFTDLLQIGIDPEMGQPAWSAAVNSTEGYLWFSLRDPDLLPSTILWIENGGRHQQPWNGRNCSLGVEDVCSFFDTGSSVSSGMNAFSTRGIRTIQEFEAHLSLSIPYIQGVVRTPPGFTHVRSVHCDEHGATFADEAGREVSSRLCANFVFGESL
jgi:hypothetical protein